SQGNVYATGSFLGLADFDPRPSFTSNLTSAGDTDIFVTRLTASAGALQSAYRMGGPGADAGRGVAIDGSGNVYLTGSFSGTATFATAGPTSNLTSAGFTDVFVAKLAQDALVWASGMGGASGSEAGNAVAVGPAGDVYTTGFFRSSGSGA